MKNVFVSASAVLAVALTLAWLIPKSAHANIWDDFVNWVEDVHEQHVQFWEDFEEHLNTCQTSVLDACDSSIRGDVANGDAAQLYLPFVLPKGSNGKDEPAFEWLQAELGKTVNKPVRHNVVLRVRNKFFPDGHPDPAKRPRTREEIRAAEERARREREEAERRAYNFNANPRNRLGDSRFPFGQSATRNAGRTEPAPVAQQSQIPSRRAEDTHQVAYSQSVPGCNEQSTPGTFFCDGTVATSQTLDAGSGEALVVFDASDFSIDVARGNAIELKGSVGSTGIRAAFTQGITARGRGIRIDNEGSGDTLLTTGSVASTGGRGIQLSSGSTSGVANISANGAIVAHRAAILVNHAGAGRLAINAGDSVAATRGPGIRAHVAASNTDGVEINSAGRITAHHRGIFVENAGSGDTSINTAGIEGGYEGIYVDNIGTGDVAITAGDIRSGGDGISVSESHGAVSVIAAGLIDASETGIAINHKGPGSVSIASTGGIRSEKDFAVYATSAHHASAVPAGSGMTINVAGDIGASDDRVGRSGIRSDHSNKGDLDIAAGRIFADRFGIYAVTGVNSGAATLAANGEVVVGGAGIRVTHAGAGRLTINAREAIAATRRAGILGRLAATNTGGIEIRADGRITSDRHSGIHVVNEGTGDIAIAAAEIESRRSGIIADNASSGNTTITISGDVSAGTGIKVHDRGGVGDILVALGGLVAGNNGTAIEMRGGASQKLVLNPGASFSGKIKAGRSDAILELAAGEGQIGTFALTSLIGGSNFVNFDKTGDGTWDLVGAQATGSNEFASADIEAGVLRLSAATFRLSSGSDLTIAPGATLEIDGTSILQGGLVNNGMIALGSTGKNGDANDRLTVTGGYATGGSLTLDVDFASGSADQLVIKGGVSGTSATEVDLRAGAAISDIGGVTVPEKVLIDVAGPDVGADDDFTAGRIYDGVTMHDFTLERSSSDGDWRIATIGPQPAPAPVRTARGPTGSFSPVASVEGTESASPGWSGQLGGFDLTALDRDPRTGSGTIMPSVPTYESYAATILELSQLSYLHDRIGSRIWFGDEGSGLWAGIDGNNITGSSPVAGVRNGSTRQFSPSGTMGSNRYEVDTIRKHFGFEHPLGEDLIFGGNLWFNRAEADVFSSLGDGGITVNGYGFAATFSWHSDEGFYADGQAQYAGFSSSLFVDGQLQVSDNDAFSLSASGEVGYRVPLGETMLTTRSQLIWSDLEFDDFMDPTMARISLEDGDSLTGRLGVSANREWNDGEAQGNFYGRADLNLPLDGQTGARVAGVSLTSDLREPVIELGLGASWRWDNLHSLHGEVGTAQGDDTEEYRAKIRVKIGF